MIQRLLHIPKIRTVIYTTSAPILGNLAQAHVDGLDGAGGVDHLADFRWVVEKGMRRAPRVRQLIFQLIDIANRDFKMLHYNSVNC